jgi:predicted transcriptional regulator
MRRKPGWLRAFACERIRTIASSKGASRSRCRRRPASVDWRRGREIDARAKALNVSRSALLARAAREFLASHRPAKDATAAWNRAIDRGGQPGEEPAATLARKRTKAVIRSRRSREKGG